MNRPAAVVVLIVRFLRALVLSGVQTLGVILRSGTGGRVPPPAAFVRIGFAPMSPQGAALLGCMISLTPGTTVINIDPSAQEMVLHMLDASHARDKVDAILREFEPGLLAWFGVRA